jgi:hypothetical protein
METEIPGTKYCFTNCDRETSVDIIKNFNGSLVLDCRYFKISLTNGNKEKIDNELIQKINVIARKIEAELDKHFLKRDFLDYEISEFLRTNPKTVDFFKQITEICEQNESK